MREDPSKWIFLQENRVWEGAASRIFKGKPTLGEVLLKKIAPAARARRNPALQGQLLTTPKTINDPF